MVSALSLAALTPPAAFIAFAIWLTSGRPVIHATRRVGKGGRVFSHYRFRTAVGAPPVWTPLGRFIGNLSLDEIPSLWNVIRGDLTLVGPRPARVEEVQFDDPQWLKILTVRPGLLSPAGLTFLDRFNRMDVRERIGPDAAYVDHHSWRTDLRLILKALWLWIKMGHLKGRF